MHYNVYRVGDCQDNNLHWTQNKISYLSYFQKAWIT